MMKRKIVWASLIAVFALGVAGCGNHSKSTASHSKTSQSTKVADKPSTKKTVAKVETPKPSAMTTLLKPLMGKNAEDQGTQGDKGMTYSQFYYRQGNWHWRVTAKSGTVIDAKVLSLGKSEYGESQLKVQKGHGDNFTVDLSRPDQGAYYSVKSKALDHTATYLIGDTDGHWTAGAPSELTGTWSTHIYSVSDGDDPYERTRFFISSDGVGGERDTFTSRYTVDKLGSGWGANDEAQYQKLADNSYLLKTHLQGRFVDAYRVVLKNNQLTVDDGAYHMSNMYKASAKPGQAFGSDNSPAKNLTSDQLYDWIFRHLPDYNQMKHTYKKAACFPSTKDDQGRAVVRVIDNGRKDFAPTIGFFRVSAMGVLEAQSDGGDEWYPVSDDPDN
ncbi:hypothetical protein [Levilactobacillus suantsaiihabitans]|uniref:Lipoprotein n=1 Tax=Levilactobacillus suantsaiihabitans TaxID=2487722 RepID=A0A4Z0JBX1_9LACO|nr:hypothetical protein [Levilactobacillus suantsaiihabitans]TGD19827.1 hypothetical protein EGT51_03040 [Levilactobacillus suantsaiihabitans]